MEHHKLSLKNVYNNKQNIQIKNLYLVTQSEIVIDDNGLTTVYGISIYQYHNDSLIDSLNICDFSTKYSFTCKMVQKLQNNQIAPNKAKEFIEDELQI